MEYYITFIARFIIITDINPKYGPLFTSLEILCDKGIATEVREICFKNAILKQKFFTYTSQYCYGRGYHNCTVNSCYRHRNCNLLICTALHCVQMIAKWMEIGNKKTEVGISNNIPMLCSVFCAGDIYILCDIVNRNLPSVVMSHVYHKIIVCIYTECTVQNLL